MNRRDFLKSSSVAIISVTSIGCVSINLFRDDEIEQLLDLLHYNIRFDPKDVYFNRSKTRKLLNNLKKNGTKKIICPDLPLFGYTTNKRTKFKGVDSYKFNPKESMDNFLIENRDYLMLYQVKMTKEHLIIRSANIVLDSDEYFTPKKRAFPTIHTFLEEERINERLSLYNDWKNSGYSRELPSKLNIFN